MRKRKALAEINVVPYIDVMIVLLVIFMVTAPLLTQGVSVDLPQGQAKALTKEQKEPIVVSIDAQGLYYLNTAQYPDKPINARALMHRVAAEIQLAKREGQKRAIYVKGDKNVDYGKVVGAMVMLQKAGADSVGLMTQPQSESPVSNR